MSSSTSLEVLGTGSNHSALCFVFLRHSNHVPVLHYISSPLTATAFDLLNSSTLLPIIVLSVCVFETPESCTTLSPISIPFLHITTRSGSLDILGTWSNRTHLWYPFESQKWCTRHALPTTLFLLITMRSGSFELPDTSPDHRHFAPAISTKVVPQTSDKSLSNFLS
jgi:hypothetical protein